MKKLLIATSNEGKIKELRELLKDLNYEIISLNEIRNKIGSFEVNETGTTFEENAFLKAKGYAEKTDLPTLADDSGICVDALGGKPGVYTARYSNHNQEKGIQKLLEELKNVSGDKRGAHYEACLVYYDPITKTEFVADGKVFGKIALEPKGNQGFAFDPIFYYTPFKKTFGEVGSEEKNKVSHRGKALIKLKKFLSSQG